jgi:NADPH:quinone reductase and related Zn-dependent oxidoreductases
LEAAVCTGVGGLDSVEFLSVPRPEAGPGRALVEVFAAGVNFPDLLCAEGKYPIRSEPPFILGIEGAGRVVATAGEANGLSVGDLVCWQDNVAKASFAEFALVPTESAVRVPAGFDMIAAAAVPTVYGTSYFALGHRAGLRAGETLLVHGASGGTGTAAVQIGKHLGARVIATGTSTAKLEVVREMGADAVIDLTAGDFREQVADLTGGKGVDVVFDPVGGALFEPSIRALRPQGRMLVIGFTSGAFPTVPANILLVKAASVIGVNYGHFLSSEPGAARRALETVLQWMDEGAFRPRINRVFALQDAALALGQVADRGVVGKNVIAISREAQERITR